MDKETLSNYGWIVICVLVLAVMIALAGPFGNFIADAVKSTTQGLFDVNQGALDAAGIVIDDNGFADGESSGADDAGNGRYNHNAPELHHNGVIPEGARYIKSDGTVLNAGDLFPETVQTTDTYYYGDYKYTREPARGTVNNNTTFQQSGWRFEVVDRTKTEYAPVLESIAGMNVTCAYRAFADCKNMNTTPVIPQYATEGFQAVWAGSSVKNIPEGVIPENAKVSNIAIMGEPLSQLFGDKIEYAYLPENFAEGTLSASSLGNESKFDMDVLYVSCKVTYTQSSMITSMLPAYVTTVNYYHHSTCDGSCGK